MKNNKHLSTIFIGLIFSLVFHTNSNAQVYNGDLYLYTQASVDAFDYTEVTGNLGIYGGYQYSAIEDLQPLEKLTRVGGALLLFNTYVFDLYALRNLTSVRDIVIAYNPLLAFFWGGLESLTIVDGSIIFLWNGNLWNFDGLQNITSVGEDLIIEGNNNMSFIDSNLDGLQNITSIGGDLEIKENVKLSNLDALQNLNFVGQDIHITDNSALIRFCGLYPLLSSGTVGGNINISDNGANPTVEEIMANGPCTIMALIESIEQLINEGVLNQGQGSALTKKLDVAVLKITNGQITTAITILNAFVNQVNSYITEGILTEEEGQELVSSVNDLIDQINVANNLLESGNNYVTEEIQNEIPDHYTLAQNYPNPFNPSTSISYQLPEASNVTIRVYDVLGKEVATLVNEKKPAGYYDVEFNATNLPSGIYFYRLQAGDFIETKKMILMK